MVNAMHIPILNRWFALIGFQYNITISLSPKVNNPASLMNSKCFSPFKVSKKNSPLFRIVNPQQNFVNKRPHPLEIN